MIVVCCVIGMRHDTWVRQKETILMDKAPVLVKNVKDYLTDYLTNEEMLRRDGEGRNLFKTL